MSDAEQIGDLAGDAISAGIQATDNAADAALRAATSEVVSEINAERAEAAAEIATAATLDAGRLDALTAAVGRIEAKLDMMTAPAAVIDPDPVTVVVEGDEIEEAPVEVVEEIIEDGIEEVADTAVEVEDAIDPPAGRRKRRGLMRRSRGRG